MFHSGGLQLSAIVNVKEREAARTDDYEYAFGTQDDKKQGCICSL